MVITYVVNGWREVLDDDGCWRYYCDDCGTPEGEAHRPNCPRYQQRPLDEEEYVIREGDACPKCLSCSIYPSGQYGYDCGVAWREVECGECGGRWVESYKLCGYEMREDLKG